MDKRGTGLTRCLVCLYQVIHHDLLCDNCDMKKVLKSLFNLLLAIPVSLFGGFVFSHLWNWFVVRKFTSAPTLSTLDAVGLMMVASFPLFSLVVHDVKKGVKQENPKMSDTTISVVVSLLMLGLVYPIMLGVGYLWHMVIGQ